MSEATEAEAVWRPGGDRPTPARHRRRRYRRGPAERPSTRYWEAPAEPLTDEHRELGRVHLARAREILAGRSPR